MGFAEILLMPQPPLLTRRGMAWSKQLEQFIHGFQSHRLEHKA